MFHHPEQNMFSFKSCISVFVVFSCLCFYNLCCFSWAWLISREAVATARLPSSAASREQQRSACQSRVRQIGGWTGALDMELLSRILNYLLPFVVTMFCGRLGNAVMAGYGLASATINVTTVATGYGLGLACDTLVSQTFGGKNLRQVGVILQRSIIILMLFCLPCWGLLINAQSILLCLGQEPEVSRIAQLYITAFLPAVPAMFLHSLQVSYLQNQGIILPQLYAAALANLASGATNYILIYWLDLGVGGSAAANTLSQIYICVFLFAYIRWKKLHVKTWGGWSVESLQEWGSYMKLALPSALMKCFEWWVYEFGGFFAGMLSEDELAAQHAVIMVAYITYMFPLGIQAAACARVGNALGAGDSSRAILTSKVSLGLAATFAVAEGLVLGSSKTVIGLIFTSDERIIGLVSQLMNAYCFLQFFDGLVCVCTGIFLGTGKQKIPAVANFIGYYCVGLTLSVTLMFAAKLRVLGFWVGLLVCVVLQSSFYIVVIFRLNWEKVTEEAVKRAQKSLNTLDSEGTPDRSTHGEKPVDGYVSVSTEAHDGNPEREGGHVVRQLKDNRLSITQLIIRRGLTVFAAVALLAVGAAVLFLVPLPEIQSAESNYTRDWINVTYSPDSIFSTQLVPSKESE
ncbi:transcript variant X2 [Nothobranchius furzeri]|uniref:Multidrug and toxin extrusion protein n=2 Tax=Nothobranchius furzeri TaxID=105023 RepID=A0A9D3BQE2_NOTFU|nr:transcript variant X2 [Nothobranchius furzeri]